MRCARLVATDHCVIPEQKPFVIPSAARDLGPARLDEIPRLTARNDRIVKFVATATRRAPGA